MIVAGHFYVRAEASTRVGDPLVVRGDDDLVDRSRCAGSLPDVLDHRFARDGRERFAGKTGGAIAGGKDGEDAHDSKLPDTGIRIEAART
jgi:hypothetical protein